MLYFNSTVAEPVPAIILMIRRMKSKDEALAIKEGYFLTDDKAQVIKGLSRDVIKFNRLGRLDQMIPLAQMMI